MNAMELLAKLKAKGIKLEASGNSLRYCPASALTDDLRVRLVEYKAEILTLIRPDTQLLMHDNKATGEIADCDHCKAPIFVGQMFCDYCGRLLFW